MSLIESYESLAEIKSTMLNALKRAGNDHKSAFRFIILNTISDGFPNSRYVVLRRFNITSQELFIYTDSRSTKIEEIKQNPFCSVLTYDRQNKCQIKLRGKMSIHHMDEVAKEHWNSLEGGKESYNTEAKPGKKVNSMHDANQMKDEYNDDYFSVLAMKVSRAEILQLSGDGHIRVLYDFENESESFLVP